jgi:carbonic anhydrase
MSSMTRTLALACAVKGGREIAIIGHTDCQVRKTTAMQLLNKFKELGVDRHQLPDDLNEFFGLFSSERQNVIKGCDIVRRSPLIGPKIPVHGLMLDIETGKLDWLVNGYEAWQVPPGAVDTVKTAGPASEGLGSFAAFNLGEMKFPEQKIGETVAKAENWLAQKAGKIGEAIPGTPETRETVARQVVDYAQKHWPTPAGAQPPTVPPKIPIPPSIRPRIVPPRGRR